MMRTNTVVNWVCLIATMLGLLLNFWSDVVYDADYSDLHELRSDLTELKEDLTALHQDREQMAERH